jgi:23S rRNA (uracil1939-C5)-methyltransferase
VQIQHLLEIQKIITGGMGLGRLKNSMVAMVPHVLPGELVEVEETKRHRGYIEARVRRILHPAPDRRPPPCELFGRCGGCQLQHAVYGAQLAAKEGIAREMLARAGLEPAKGLGPILASPETMHYRYKLRLHCGRNGKIGFHRKRSNTLVPVTSCQLATGPLNDALARLAAMKPGDCFRELELICSPADQGVAAVLSVGRSRRPVAEIELARIREQGGLAGLALRRGRQIEPVGDWFGLRQEFFRGGKRYTLSWDCRSFFQVNPAQNEQLVRLVLDFAGTVEDCRVLDLYCGMGNFSIPLALAGAEVHGVEVNPHAIRAAGANAERAGLADRVRFTAMAVEEFVHTTLKTRPGLVLVDPPRQGLGRAAGRIAELGAERIVYISCDPATLIRDLQKMCAQGYSLVRLQPVDMFPQTGHIESVAVLEKN